jgi:hypothetical protein
MPHHFLPQLRALPWHCTGGHCTACTGGHCTGDRSTESSSSKSSSSSESSSESSGSKGGSESSSSESSTASYSYSKQIKPLVRLLEGAADSLREEYVASLKHTGLMMVDQV